MYALARCVERGAARRRKWIALDTLRREPEVDHFVPWYVYQLDLGHNLSSPTVSATARSETGLRRRSICRHGCTGTISSVAPSPTSLIALPSHRTSGRRGRLLAGHTSPLRIRMGSPGSSS